MIITSQVGYNMAGPTHKAMPWQPPTQSLKNVSEWDNDQYNPLPKFEPLLYSLIVDLFFALNIKIIPHWTSKTCQKSADVLVDCCWVF